MNLFKTVNPELFTILASPNRVLYADALDVLYEAYQDHLKLPESEFHLMLSNKLAQQIIEAKFEDEDIDKEELSDISGRARFIIRKLYSKGWFEKERGKDFEEYIILPDYSSKLLELFHKLTDNSTIMGYSYVFGTYSSLKVAYEGKKIYNKMIAIYSAYDNTNNLIKLLKSVYHNVKYYFKKQLDIYDVNNILATHFNDFEQNVIESYIRPLKIKDSVPKYKVPIQIILDDWLEDSNLLLSMSNAALIDKRKETLEDCYSDIVEKICWIKERYDKIESEYLDEIDLEVRRYTRATTQKIINLTNRNKDTHGNLNYLLNTISKKRQSADLLEKIQPIFNLYEQSFISEKSLLVSKPKQTNNREKVNPVIINEGPIEDSNDEYAKLLLKSRYGKARVGEYMKEKFGQSKVCYSKDLGLCDDYTYIMSLLVIIEGSNPDSFYNVEQLEGSFTQGPYTIPQLRFELKEEKEDKNEF